MMLDSSTHLGLDWAQIEAALADRCQTIRGLAAVPLQMFSADATTVRFRFAAVAEVIALDERSELLPFGGVSDVMALARAAEKGERLEGADLREAGVCLAGLDRLKRWLGERQDVAPSLAQLGAPIAVDPVLLDDLENSFEPSGALSGQRYPQLAALRSRIEQLQQSVRATLEAMLTDPNIAPRLQDRYITDRAGRFVLPIRSNARKGLGLVHDTSQSGETSFVEPTAVIEPQNELKGAAGELAREEQKVLADLSRSLGEQADAVEQSLEAATALDLAQARARLGLDLSGVIPDVVGGAVVRLQAARHPILVLRGVDVIPNDLALTDDCPGMVLSGPNAGGKTVALKTLGLVVLMVRAGIPVPAADGAQVGLFDVVRALVGDMQDVGDDLSTFSAHLVGIRQCLEDAGSRSLLLLDEIGGGTDPAQGAALAQAVVETLIQAGSRVVLTTHFAVLKELAARDDRMALMGAVFADGRPTYRVEAGRTGHSHALAVARRMDLPEAVVERARVLLDEDTRRVDDLVRTLEQEQEEVRQQAVSQAETERRLVHQAEKLETRAAKLDARRDKEDADLRETFKARLREQENELKALIKALQAAPSSKEAGEALARVRAARAALQPPSAPRPAPPERVAVGDTVKLPLLGGKGVVVDIGKGGRIEVDVRGKRVRVRLEDLGLAPQPAPSPFAPTPGPITEGEVGSGVRTSVNTLDLRGKRVEESLEAVDAFLDELLLAGQSCAYILHGHGTGALKEAIRSHLPASRYSKSWHPGGPEEGGDAFTVVEL